MARHIQCNPCVPLPQMTGAGTQENQLSLEISEPAVQDEPRAYMIRSLLVSKVS